MPGSCSRFIHVLYHATGCMLVMLGLYTVLTRLQGREQSQICHPVLRPAWTGIDLHGITDGS